DRQAVGVEPRVIDGPPVPERDENGGIARAQPLGRDVQQIVGGDTQGLGAAEPVVRPSVADGRRSQPDQRALARLHSNGHGAYFSSSTNCLVPAGTTPSSSST